MNVDNVIQIVTFVLGLIGSAGTFWNYFQNRKCYDIKIESSTLEPSETGYVLVLELQFLNCSRLPLAITDAYGNIPSSFQPLEKLHLACPG